MGPFFDTHIVIDWLRDRPGASDELRRHAGHRISRIVWTEVLAGESPDRRSTIAELLELFAVVEVDDRIALMAADIRHRTRMRLLDAFMLATAQAHGVLLVTRNTRDFPADMPGIRVPYIL